MLKETIRKQCRIDETILLNYNTIPLNEHKEMAEKIRDPLFGIEKYRWKQGSIVCNRFGKNLIKIRCGSTV